MFKILYGRQTPDIRGVCTIAFTERPDAVNSTKIRKVAYGGVR